MLFVHRSNRVEKLVESLGDILEHSSIDPFETEPIIVQGRGMERWLSMELARRFGVWANPSFPFPRRFLLDLFHRNLDLDAAGLACFEPESLSWAIAARLPELLGRAEFSVLRAYLGDRPEPGRLLSLCRRIATTFDDYAVFRAEMIAGWEKGAGGGWEPALWRRLIEDLGRNHVAARAELLLDRLRDGAAADLPARVCLFGISTLAPLYLRIFAQLAAGQRELHLFVLSPTDQYWAQIRDRREVVRERWASGDGDGVALEEVLEQEVGNRLLASLGRLGREFQAVLEGAVDYVDDPVSLYEDPAELERGDPSVLSVLQSDMLALRYRDARLEPRPSGGDGSVSVHSCHGPMRETQVLYDQLLSMFESDPSLRPRDVIVMTPDIDTYAPFVEAVFGGGDGGGRIPFRIADRGPAATNEVFEAFAELLRMLPGRLSSAEVVDLLRREVVRRCFGFDEPEIELVREWIDRTEIRWGIDEAHRDELGHGGGDQNTWQFGLRRMFLGYAVGGDDDGAQYAPYDDIEGGDALALGRLAELCSRLFAAARRLAAPLRIAEWPREVERLIGDFFSQQGPAAFQAQALREAVQRICERAVAAGYEGPVDLATMTALTEDELRMRSLAHGFLSGDVTFCELVPMRTIPFRVVCLVGMNDGAFPRVERRPDFDRMGTTHRWGDRSLRDDDRYMFLEALLSARDRLYISFVGQDAQTSARMPPSVVVQELLDVLDDSFANMDADTLVVRHPMQAFSPRYFEVLEPAPTKLRSFSVPAYRGAAALVGERVAAGRFVSERLPWQGADGVSIRDFERFFENPTRAFLQKRLRLFLGKDMDILETREPLDLDDLDRWKIGDALLRRRLAKQPCDFEVVARLGALPTGAIGEATHEEILDTVSRIAAGAYRSGLPCEPLDVDLDLGPFRIGGVLERVAETVQERHQYSKVGGRQELSLWIRHLLLSAALPGRHVESRLCARKDARSAAVVRFAGVEDAPAKLAELASLYAEGMAAPLPLFDGASRVYAESRGKGDNHERARAKAERAYLKVLEERPDPYVAQVYGTDSPFADAAAQRAAEVAMAVYRDFLGARVQEDL